MTIINKLVGKFMTRIVEEIDSNTRIKGRIESRHPIASVKIGRDSLVANVDRMRVHNIECNIPVTKGIAEYVDWYKSTVMNFK